MKHRCISHVSFSSGSRSETGGGAILPEDWKYRLGEQLKLNMQSMAQPQAPADASFSSKENEVQEKIKHANEKEPMPNGALVEPFPVTHNADAVLNQVTDNRWIDAPPSPLSSNRDVTAKMRADKDVYLSGQELDAPPPKSNPAPIEASRHRLTKLLSNANAPQPINSNTSTIASQPVSDVAKVNALPSSAQVAALSPANADATNKPNLIAPSDPTAALHDASSPSPPQVPTTFASQRPKKPSPHPHEDTLLPDTSSSHVRSSHLALGSADIDALTGGF